jgi:Ca2+-transporting ATPase
MEPVWALPAGEVAARLQVEPASGLSTDEAARRLAAGGANRLPGARRTSAWRLFARQLESLTTLLLVAAAAAAFLFGEWVEGLAIVAVLALNSAIGFATELKAVRSIEALRRLGVAYTRVRRAGRVREVPAEELVAGDVVLIEAGDLVTADLRLLSSSRLQSDESQLTGESLPVDKGPDAVPAETPLAERSPLLYKGTPVVRGAGEGVVTATGARTELGRIAALAESSTSERTPLEERLERLGRTLAGAALGIAAVTTLVGMLSGRGLFLMLETGVALAVAAIPEGLPIVATLALARGVWRMAQRDALVNRLSAVEALGAVTLICTDKTGTLTQNLMTLTRIAVAAGDLPPEAPEPSVREALTAAVLCSNASLDRAAGASGDPLELALLAAGERAGLHRGELLARWPEEREEAFDPATRMMATFHRAEGGFRVAVKGAPEAVLAACELRDEDRRKWQARNQELALQGYRVLALAGKETAALQDEPYTGLTWRGLAVLEDPPRPDAGEAVEACRRAGIRVVMVTGDQVATARAVASAVGLTAGEASVVSGAELRRALAGAREDRERLLAADIFARVDPEQKLDLVALHQEAGAIVGMTGDGVNDAPALRKADVGVAMGRRGSPVAREAAAVILKDDSFSTLVAAVRQGRVIFSNIRRFVFYLLSCNTAEVLVVGTASLITLPLPVLPLQLLFLNLVTDVFPALALGLGEGGPGVMERPPQDPAAPLLGRRRWASLAGYAVLMAGAVFGALVWVSAGLGLDARQSVTVTFLTLACTQLWHAFNLRAGRNPYLWGAVLGCLATLVLAVYVPPIAGVLHLADPGVRGWGVVAVMSLLPLAVGTIVRRAAGSPPRALLLPALLAFAGVCRPAWPAPQPQSHPAPAAAASLAQATLRARVPASGAAPRLVLEGRSVPASPFLACFYQRRDFAPAWSDGAALRPAVDDLLAALAAAEDDGLRPEDYWQTALQRRAGAVRSRPEAGELADLDLLLSNAFLTFAAHLRSGKVNPEAIYPDCALGRDATDLADILAGALATGRVRATLAGLAPAGRGYELLRRALSRYRRLALRDDLGPVPPGPALRAGDRGERVLLLRARLAAAAAADAAAEDESLSEESPDLFSASLTAVVRRFQERHGLEPDGVAGAATLAELNQRAEDHIRQIEVNLERWRWLPHDLGKRHVLVNIAAFRLDAVEDGRTALRMRVIVGKPYTRTPMFSSAMRAVILNPSWYVPGKIAVNEIFPKARKDPSYLAREGYEILPGARLRQKPGPHNALGRIKLVFPNRFDVYLHDTPAPALFSRTVRTFSHGCIRLEKPFDLAVWALKDDPQWTADAIRAGIDAGRERTVPLAQTIPVHVAYWTAWVDEDGALRLGRDVYQRDAQLARRLGD